MTIEFARGDSYEKGFILKRKAGDPIVEAWDEVYFTVKRSYTDPEYRLQKRLTAGGIVDDGDGHFTILFMPQDTDGMSFGTYDCDIEFVKDTYKRTFPLTLKLTKEVTYVSNE